MTVSPFRLVLLLSCSALLFAVEARAQTTSTNPVLELRGVLPNASAVLETAQFGFDNAGGFFARGEIGVGTLPVAGPGTRLMWSPYFGALRTGGVDGTQWDFSEIGFYSFAGGRNSVASHLTTFAFGDETEATAAHAVALGRTALAQHIGSFVWADAQGAELASAGDHTFQIRASGGVWMYTDAANSLGVSLEANGTSWEVLSDRNAKADFASIDGEALLARLAEMPVTTWRYRADSTGTRHAGPMAQDWQRLVAGPLGLNADSLKINQGDFDGVNLAAVQALERRTRALEAENARLRAALAALAETRQAEAAEQARALAALAARLGDLEAALGRATTTASATAPATAPTTAPAETP